MLQCSVNVGVYPVLCRRNIKAVLTEMNIESRICTETQLQHPAPIKLVAEDTYLRTPVAFLTTVLHMSGGWLLGTILLTPECGMITVSVSTLSPSSIIGFFNSCKTNKFYQIKNSFFLFLLPLSDLKQCGQFKFAIQQL